MEGKLVGGYLADRGGVGGVVDVGKGSSDSSSGAGLLFVLGIAAGAYVSYKLFADTPARSYPSLKNDRRSIVEKDVIDVPTREIVVVEKLAPDNLGSISSRAVLRTPNRTIRAQCSGTEIQVRCDGLIHVIPAKKVKCFARRHLSPHNPSLMGTFILLTDESELRQVTPLQEYLHFTSQIGTQTLPLKGGAFSVTALA